jgi:hypothetical protein
MPVIPTTWEVEIRKITIQGQPGEKLGRTPFQTINWSWWFSPVVPGTWKAWIGGLRSRLRPYLKNKAKRAVGLVQVLECLPSKCEVLNNTQYIYLYIINIKITFEMQSCYFRILVNPLRIYHHAQLFFFLFFWYTKENSPSFTGECSRE